MKATKPLEAEDGKAGLSVIQQGEIDLIIADIMMPHLDGTGLVSVLRADPKTRLMPIIMLTALDQRASQRKFMEIGADDYITKPFDLSELLRAVQTQLRKKTWRQDQGPLPSGDVTYSFAGWRFETDRRRLVSEDGREDFLTVSEAQLLTALLARPNTVLNREHLFDLLGRPASSPFDRTIDVLVSRLRRKMEEDPKSPKLFVTVRNVGYLFGAEVEQIKE